MENMALTHSQLAVLVDKHIVLQLCRVLASSLGDLARVAMRGQTWINVKRSECMVIL